MNRITSAVVTVVLSIVLIILSLSIMVATFIVQSNQSIELPIPAGKVDHWPIQQAYVINMDTHVDRLANMKRQLEYLEIPFERFSAVSKSWLEQLASDNMNNFKAPLKGIDQRIKRTVGDLFDSHYLKLSKSSHSLAGCAFSHLSIMSKVIDLSNDEPVLVFEDDVEFDRYFKHRVADAISVLNEHAPNWEVFFPGYCNASYGSSIRNHRELTRAKDAYCLQAYVVRNRAVAQKILDFANFRTCILAADQITSQLIHSGALETYLFTPNNIAVQARCKFESSISASDDIDCPHIRYPIE